MTSRYHDVWSGLFVARRVGQGILYSLLYNCPLIHVSQEEFSIQQSIAKTLSSTIPFIAFY